ncbi:MAG: hypothetical protein Ta2B_00910 [Termitinemataceae bacterium]|nr:MAG: hypothetical protein Ta2B_00910 [Termitinemataceae bacterium]
MTGRITGKIVLDTTILINNCNNDSLDALSVELSEAEVFISVITRIELYSYHEITVDEVFKFDKFLKDVSVIPLSDEIEQQTIKFRKATHCKLPDSIIAATAMLLGATVLTNDIRFGKVKFDGLKIMLLE